MSSNYPSSYASYDDCTITVLHAGTVYTKPGFNTEANYDELWINNVAYSGTTGPSGVSVAANAEIYWSADVSTNGAGWKLCMSGQPPSTKAPTKAPTNATKAPTKAPTNVPGDT